MIGQSIGTYRITAKLGAGGMGEVYRARDTKLDRDVALKILPDSFSHDAERVARFEREAKVLAALNHPNIAQIYGLEERALVMELVEGPTLAERIAQGALPLDEAMNIAKQIAEALETAHEKGITHRDLKPANVKITPQGVVKVLDFGLATAAHSSVADDNPSISPTLTLDYAATRAGMIVGTAAYMSPEQARGQQVDRRSDIWAFGVLLYEMITGRRAFEGATISDTLAAVLKSEPDWSKVPARVRRLLERCLQKESQRRLLAIGDWDLLLANENVFLPRDEIGRKQWKWIGTVAVLIVVVLVLGFVSFRHLTEAPLRVLKISVLPPEKTSQLNYPSVSPDGRQIVFVATLEGKDQLWVRSLDSLAARMLPGTEGAGYPFWAPDSNFIGFFAGGKLKKIDVAGGPALTLCDAIAGRGGTWNRDGVIVFAPNFRSGLFRVPAAGGSATQITMLDETAHENAHRTPWFLPDGHHFLYTARTDQLERSTVYIVDLESKARHPVLTVSSNVVYAPPGYLLFVREQTLMAQAFDASKGAVTGEPVPLAEHVDFDALNIAGRFSASQTGVLAFTSGGAAGEVVQLTWFDRTGKSTGTVGTAGVLHWPVISPDERTIAFDRQDEQTGTFDIWLHDLARGSDSRFTFDAKTNQQFPVWSPDASHILFQSFRPGKNGGVLFQKSIGSSAREDVVVEDTFGFGISARPTDWSRDGRYIVVDNTPSNTEGDIWVQPMFGDRKRFYYLQTDFNERGAKLSPNGRWVAYASNETNRDEIYVQTFPDRGGKWQVSTNGGYWPVWSRDGRELYFVGSDRRMMASEVKSGEKFEASVPRPLFDSHTESLNRMTHGFDVSKDGRFLIPAPVTQSASAPITLVVNWTAAFKR